MMLSVSNLAWDVSEDDAALAAVVRSGGGAIDLAPTKLWKDLERVTPADATAYAESCRRRGVSIVALQSLLFGKPDLQLFGEPPLRAATLSYLDGVIALGAALGASHLILGAAHNRRRNGHSRQACVDLAVPLFRYLADAAQRRSAIFCLEPMAPQYGCDFVCDTDEAVQLAEQVNHPAFGIALDTGTLALNGEELGTAVATAWPYLRYVQLAEPELHPIDLVAKTEQVRCLRQLGYRGWVSIEMLSQRDGNDLLRVADAVTQLAGLPR